MRTVTFLGFLSLAALSACVDVPELDRAISDDAHNAPYPRLVPVENIRAETPSARITPETGHALDQRAGSLQRKADALRKPVIDSATRARMERGVRR